MQNKFLLIKTLIDYILTIYFAQILDFNIKMANKKKHDAYFSNPSTDLKSVRKNTMKTLYSQTRCFFSKIKIGKLHCALSELFMTNPDSFLENYQTVSL